MKKALLLLGCAGAIAQASAQNWLDTGNPGVGIGTNFLGAINNAPIDIRTNNTQRFRLNHTVSYTIGSFAAQAKNGALGLSPNNTLWANGPGPISRLHLHDGTTSVLTSPYRPWMDNGITFTTNSDQMYIGHKVESGSDQTSAVIQWGDNDAPEAGPDVLKFLFMGGYTGGTYGVGGLNGRELGRFHPQGFLGLGDWQSVSLQPTERVDLLNGRLRIRQLPNDPAANTLTKVLVVDDSPTPSGERGVVKWRSIASLGGCSSGWSLSGNNAVTAFDGNSCPPQSIDRVGIGLSTPSSKLHVVADLRAPGMSYTAANIQNVIPSYDESGTDYVGVEAYTSDVLLPPNPNSVNHFGGRFYAANGTKMSIGVHGQGLAFPGFNSPVTIGVRGEAHPNNGGTSYGVQGISSGTGSAGYFLNSGGGVGLRVDGNTSLTGTIFVSGVGWINGGTPIVSDQDLKHDIHELENASDLIEQLRPKRYYYNTDQYNFLGLPAGERMGLLAQEVEQVIPSIVHSSVFPAQYDSLGAVIREEMPLKGIDYTALIPLLLAGMREQNARIAYLEEQLAACCSNPDGGTRSMPVGPTGTLEEGNDRRLQIQPNPFNEATTVSYTLERAGRMQLLVNSSDGKQLNVLEEAQRAAGDYRYEWSTSALKAGMYYVTLLLDGQPVVKKAVKVAR